jgi:hypothetical protein
LPLEDNMADSKTRTGPKPIFINDIVTPEGRVSFPHLANPDAKGPGKPYADDKYKASLLMPKKDTDFAVLRAKALECAQQAFGKDSIKSLNDFVHPFRDGNQRLNKEGEVMDGYKDCLYITCKSKDRPLTIDRAKKNIDPKDVYGGCRGRFIVTAMSYQSTENVRQPDGTTKRGESFGSGGGGKSRSVAALPDLDGGPETVAEAGAGPEEPSAKDAEDMFR